MHKYARGSDMYFILSAQVMQRFWHGMWRKRPCESWEPRSWEYVLFNDVREHEPDNRPERCGDSHQTGGGGHCVDEPLPDIEPPRAPNNSSWGTELVVQQLRSLRNVVVRSSTFLACWQAGFWCRPVDMNALLEELKAYPCGERTGSVGAYRRRLWGVEPTNGSDGAR